MSLWIWILAACAIANATKLVGYLLPERWLETPWVSTLSHGVTVGLLASLVATNAFLTGTSVSLDARLVALARPREVVGGAHAPRLASAVRAGDLAQVAPRPVAALASSSARRCCAGSASRRFCRAPLNHHSRPTKTRISAK